jgi:ubiquinone/menaquinone biosynthesis C-methylase UbiE
MDKRIQKEKKFHDLRFGGIDPRETVGKYYAVKQHANDFFHELIAIKCREKSLLEYGCGFGNSSLDYLKAGANLTGIDISIEGIRRAKKTAIDNGFRAEYLVMNAEEMTFNNEVFDFCVGSGILHHLDLNKSLKEISRVLKKDGTAIFIEPMGHNPLINWYRNRTPSMRTDDEHPLMLVDIELMNNYFSNIEINYFALTTLLAVPFRKLKAFKSIYLILQKLDRLLFQIPFIGKNAWTVVIEMSDPIKN